MDVSLEARVELERMARSSVLPHRQVVQATALLALANGSSLRSTAKMVGTYPNTVAAWRDRFVEAGVAGVGVIAPGRGRKRVIPAATIAAIVHDTLHTVPEDGSSCWSTRTLGAKHGVGKDTVARVWKARNLRPWQVDTFKLSNDPDFEAKLADVVGLYLDPPERAVVFSFDEKTQCQALERTQPSLPIKPGRSRTMTHDYKRNGTVDLFAAMNIATGEVLHDSHRRHAGTDELLASCRPARLPSGSVRRASRQDERRTGAMDYQDPVEIASDHYRLLLDGKRARIVEMRLPAGARDNEHSHPNEFVYFLQGSNVRIHQGDGPPAELDIPDGFVMEHEPWTHSVENIGDREVRALIFELKN
ncbi:MAG: IS630 family transposase [Actinobacteria bacterium]|nr:IS630 family transposase [Actinomycetota bacterium]